ncbi:DsbA family protein [Sphingomonas sp. S1-29]|uniref:DsbA family protein n=1 Tax=Sphingomonas sp. S1-29 TaxID=2991074 RepID=UPI00223F32E8|nr:DsbA family protein [Sphingomonas sp. S1-29]UZK70602.1 DsbA family protein [Sphingomonas sp. S1-29]
MKRLYLLGLAAAVLLLIAVLVGRSDIDNSAHAQNVELAGDTRRVDEGALIRAEIQNDTVVPKVAPRGYDVTVVMFSDYQCPYCRKVHPVLEQMKREDKKLRIVYRDWPIFGAGSLEAARASIASQYQGKHAAFNDAMMNVQGKVTSASIRAAAGRANVDWAKLQADMTAHTSDIDGAIDRTGRYAAMMGLSGTPAMLVGPYLIPGAIDLPGMRKAVAMARENPNGASTT